MSIQNENARESDSEYDFNLDTNRSIGDNNFTFDAIGSSIDQKQYALDSMRTNVDPEMKIETTPWSIDASTHANILSLQ